MGFWKILNFFFIILNFGSGLWLLLAVARIWVSIGGGFVLGFFPLSPLLSRVGGFLQLVENIFFNLVNIVS